LKRNVACKASPSVAKSIYTKLEEGISEWWERVGNVPWLSKKLGMFHGSVKSQDYGRM